LVILSFSVAGPRRSGRTTGRWSPSRLAPELPADLV